MQALVKTPRTDIRMRGEIPPRVLEVLRNEYGAKLKIFEEDEETVEVMETDWYREMKDRRRPGDAVRVYRDNFGYTQAELGKMLGGLSRQKVSDLENNRRGISKDIALKLAKLFRVPVERFL